MQKIRAKALKLNSKFERKLFTLDYNSKLCRVLGHFISSFLSLLVIFVKRMKNKEGEIQ